MRKLAIAAAAAAAIIAASGPAEAWTLQEAAAPYKGTTVTVVGLDRPSYVAMKELIPEFEKESGITVKVVTFPYESTLKAETLDFVSGSHNYDAILTDVIWPGVFATARWVVPISKFTSNAKLANPDLDLKDFFPVWLDGFTWGSTLYGLPFDSYSGLLYYNKCMLKDAGFSGPPTTWEELLKTYAPKLTDAKKGIYGFALQSRRGETQTADSFTRFLWLFGGEWLNPKTFEPEVDSPAAIRGLTFRQDLMKYMPPGIVSDDHGEVVHLMAQGKVAMITEWSAFYPTLASPSSSTITKCLAVTTEPSGPAGIIPAFGGFAYMVSSGIPAKKQDATWLFIQWLTSKTMAAPLINHGAVVARISADTDPTLQAKYPYLKPMVESWKHAIYYWRPRLPVYPQMSEVVANLGSQIQLGQLSVAAGMKKINDELKTILTKAGYYNGKMAKIQ
ncbi:MAG: ABC transporter substrate-binding protein [Acetobacteraceae bacterium]